MEENCEKTLKLEEKMNGKLRKTAGKNAGNRETRWDNEEITVEHRGKHIEKKKDLKLNGEQRPLGFGARRFARG